jgi:hypothetical protein
LCFVLSSASKESWVNLRIKCDIMEI